MVFWWVNLGKTYDSYEKGHINFLWAPERDSSGKEVYHWKLMNELKEGDIVFCYYKKHLQAYSFVIKTAVKSMYPFKEGDNPSRKGNRVYIAYNQIKNIIKLDNIKQKLQNDLLQSKYSPINKSGNVNQGYLFKISGKAGLYLLSEIESKEGEHVFSQIEKNIEDSHDKTTAESLIASRRGQGKFRNKLIEAWDSKCAVTECDLVEILIASHCKPWILSKDEEKLDHNNGLLLSPNYDKLFDLGYISFDENGQIIISSSLSKDTYKKLNISKNDKLFKIPSNPDFQEFLEYHRSEIFSK